MAFTFCATVPLKFTVLGVEVVTSSVPAVMVNALAIPNTELEDSCRDVPLMMVLKRLAVPLNVEVPLKVAAPAVADKVPLIVSAFNIEKLASVEMEPVTDKKPKSFVPEPVIVLDVPLRIIVPAPEVKLPFTSK